MGTSRSTPCVPLLGEFVGLLDFGDFKNQQVTEFQHPIPTRLVCERVAENRNAFRGEP
jgi:hypothetical protein